MMVAIRLGGKGKNKFKKKKEREEKRKDMKDKISRKGMVRSIEDDHRKGILEIVRETTLRRNSSKRNKILLRDRALTLREKQVIHSAVGRTTST